MDNQLIMLLKHNSPENICRRESLAEIAETCYRCKQFLEESARLITEVAHARAMTTAFASAVWKERQLCLAFITVAEKYANIQVNLHNE